MGASSDRVSRAVAGLLLAALTLFLAGSGLMARALRAVVLWSFDQLSVAVIPLPPDQFVVEGRSFIVSFWCTPTVLWLGCLYLLWHTRRALPQYMIWAFGLMFAGAAAMAVNIVLSVRWYVEGISWGWAHRPGLVLIYTGFLWLALYRSAKSCLEK